MFLTNFEVFRNRSTHDFMASQNNPYLKEKTGIKLSNFCNN